MTAAPRTLALLTVAAVLTGCSSSQSALPPAFEGMAPDEVGCVISSGGAVISEIGPLGPSDVETVEPNDYTSFRIGRTPDSVVVVVDRDRNRGSGTSAIAELPTEGVGGVVASGSWVDAANPGFSVRCWRGPSF
ncbi:MAG: hypothetical protein HKO87_03625 [Acidimicrobiia bacterium]|nr:hypothetical protein [Acidimicrobiia bacterium]